MSGGFLPGLCSVTFRALSPAAIVELCSETGLRAIEWGADVHVPPGELRLAREARELTVAADLVIPSYGSYLRAPTAGMEELAGVLRTAGALGAATIRIWPGRHGVPSSAYTGAEREAVASAIRAWAVRAADEGLTLSLEYHPGTLTDSLPSALELMTAVDHPAVFLYWQPRPGLPLATALDEVGQLGPRLSHLHVFAWDTDKTRYPLASQADYWASVLRMVGRSAWSQPRYALLEFLPSDDPQHLRTEAATLASLLQGDAPPV